MLVIFPIIILQKQDYILGKSKKWQTKLCILNYNAAGSETEKVL